MFIRVCMCVCVCEDTLRRWNHHQTRRIVAGCRFTATGAAFKGHPLDGERWWCFVSDMQRVCVCVCARVMIKCAPKMELFLIKTYSSTVQSNVCVLARTREHKRAKGVCFYCHMCCKWKCFHCPFIGCFQCNAVVEHRQLCRCNQRQCSSCGTLHSTGKRDCGQCPVSPIPLCIDFYCPVSGDDGFWGVHCWLMYFNGFPNEGGCI